MHKRFVALFTALAFIIPGITSSPTAGAITGHPSPTNVGIPSGTTLTLYTGPMTITSCGVWLDSKIIPGDITIAASNGTHSEATPCVLITKSYIQGIVLTGN